MHPLRHGEVSALLQEHNLSFRFRASDDKGNREYDTNIMGRFQCKNLHCTKSGWSSKQIAITIRLYADSQYNAKVYHQSCKSCLTLSEPELDESYAERVAYRLMKWSGLSMESPQYSDKSRGPHERSLCEGCKLGHCKGNI